MNGKADVDELPELWNDKYEEYLGYRPKNDAEGILQDVHWFSGWIGYYQCYVLANCYDGHFLHSSMRTYRTSGEKVSRGEFDEINAGTTARCAAPATFTLPWRPFTASPARP